MQLIQTRQGLQESRFVECFQQHGKSFRLVRPENLQSPKKFIIRSAIPLIVSTAWRTVSLHPVQRSYAAPTIGILRNCARNPRNWCGTRPSTLPSPSCWGCWGSCPGGGAGAWRLQKVAIKTPKYIVSSDQAEPTLEDAEGVKRGALRLLQTQWARALDASLYTSDLVNDL
jgi:hypothetical protein